MIPEVAPYNNYTGDGSTTQFDFDFYIEDSTQLIVQLTKEDGTINTLVNDTDYTIHEVGSKNGSYITFPIAGSSYSTLSNSEIISLSLSLPIAQESEYGTSSELDLQSLEYSLDYLTRICQIQARQVTRALKVAEGSNIATDELALDVEKLADISNDISIVANIASNVTAVKNNATNINTVAGDITNVNTVGENITNVNTVVGNLTNIDTVAENITDVNTVAGISGDVSTVSNISANVTAVKNNATNINSVAADLTKIDAVADDLTNIIAVKNDLTNIDAVAGNATNINAVNSNKTNIDAVAGNATNINAVAADLTKIDAVADDLTNIIAVKNDLTNIDAASSNAQLSKDWANKMTGTVDGVEFSAKYYAQQASTGQVQSNWNEADTTSKAYIQNKPSLADVATSGDYDDLTNKPTIPNETTVSGWGFTKNEGTVKSVNNTPPDANGNVNVSGGGGGDAQIQSDWSQSDNTKVDYIKNKPSLATVATSGDYDDLTNKPTIPAAQIQSDWSQSDSTQKDFIKNKPTIPTVPTTLSSFTDDLGSSPTHTHSQYLTTHQDISGKEDILKTVNVLSTSGTITLTDNSINTITPTDAVTFTLPTVTDNTKFHEILVQVNLSTVYSIDLGLGTPPHYFNNTAPDLSSAGVYNLIYEYDKANQYWVGGTIPKGAGS